MTIKWDEPKSSFRARQKEQAFAEIKNTSWLRVGILLLVVLPLAVYLLTSIYPPKGEFHWYFLPIILCIGGFFAVYLQCLVNYFGKSTISIDEEGIRLGGSDGRLRKYLYGKMTSIELIPNSQGNYSLAWLYEDKKIIRDISQEMNISEIKTLIENNSYQEVKMRQP
jgi:hypothetical protein